MIKYEEPGTPHIDYANPMNVRNWANMDNWHELRVYDMVQRKWPFNHIVGRIININPYNNKDDAIVTIRLANGQLYTMPATSTRKL